MMERMLKNVVMTQWIERKMRVENGEMDGMILLWYDMACFCVSHEFVRLEGPVKVKAQKMRGEHSLARRKKRCHIELVRTLLSKDLREKNNINEFGGPRCLSGEDHAQFSTLL